jgi:glycine/D-amino acid oxidase-like deaminating enzyme
MATRYAIVGGGIVGASVAYHLGERTDDPIVLFERGSPAAETTARSVAQYGFYGDETQYRMKRYGMALYNEFFRDPRADPAYTTMGIILVTTEAENAARFRRAVERGGDESLGKMGMGFDRDPVEYVPGDELAETLLLPLVDSGTVSGALFRPKVGYMTRPRELAFEFLERARENGVTIRSDTEVAEIETGDGRVAGLRTDAGERVEADEVICAAGPWNLDVAESVGVDLPVRHTLAPILQVDPPDQPAYSMPVVSHYESPFAFHRRREDEFLIGYNPGGYEEGTRYDPGSVGETVPAGIREEGLALAAELVPDLAAGEVVDEWVGVRSVTPDGNPVVGWTELEGFSIAAFHTSGIQLAPAVGDVIARQLVDGDPTEHYDALSITRFEGYADHRS